MLELASEICFDVHFMNPKSGSHAAVARKMAISVMQTAKIVEHFRLREGLAICINFVVLTREDLSARVHTGVPRS